MRWIRLRQPLETCVDYACLNTDLGVQKCQDDWYRLSEGRLSLCNDLMRHVAEDISEAKIPPGIVVGQILMIQAKEMQDRGIEVVDVHGPGGP